MDLNIANKIKSFGSERFLIRKAIKEDSIHFAPILASAWSANVFSEDNVADSSSSRISYQQFVRTLIRLGEREENLYSYNNVSLAHDKITGEIVAAVVSYDGSLYEKLKKPVIEIFNGFFSQEDFSETSENEYYIDSLAVKNGYRAKGLGTMLLEFVIAEAEKTGFPQITLIVEEENKKAIGLYEKLGFREIGDVIFCAQPYKQFSKSNVL